VSRRDEKRDANERPIIDALQAIGATVEQLPGGRGRPDLLVGHRKITFLLEVKVHGAKLNPLQVEFHGAWRGAPIHVVHSPIEAIMVVQRRAK
jgi:Holliday junction resolvase